MIKCLQIYEKFDKRPIVYNKTFEKIDELKSRGAPSRRTGFPDISKFRRKKTADYSANEWITTPERSLGSNHVVFGGMMLPVSAMSISCFIETG